MKMAKCGLLDALLNLLFISNHVLVLGTVITKYYSYNFLNPSTWQEARAYCRSSGDLALLIQQSDVDSLDPYIYLSWIGLYKDGNKWTWSDGTDYESKSKDWRTGHEKRGGDCAVANSTESKKFQSLSCETMLSFYCYDNDEVFVFIMWSATWENAQAYCRTHYIDLATLGKGKEIKDLADEDLFYVWTGLHRAGPGADWDWSVGRSDYVAWEENGMEDGDCVGISNTEDKMATLNCSSAWPFYCYSDNLILVKENKTWEEALEYCRAIGSPPHQYPYYHYNDLISVSDAVDHLTVWSRIKEATTDEVWTGLRYLAHQWFWVDGNNVPYEDLPQCPDLGQHCGTLDRDNSTIPWRIRDCTEKRNFLCYRKWNVNVYV